MARERLSTSPQLMGKSTLSTDSVAQHTTTPVNASGARVVCPEILWMSSLGPLYALAGLTGTDVPWT